MKRIITLLFIIFMVFTAPGCQAQRQIFSVGDKAPDFTLSDLQGNKVSLNELLKGKEIILNFWASWCPECREEMPQLDKFAKLYSDRVEIVGINTMESKEQAASFVNAKGISYRILLDSKGEVVKIYGIVGIPTNILINKDGLIKNLNLDVRQMKSYFRQN